PSPPARAGGEGRGEGGARANPDEPESERHHGDLRRPHRGVVQLEESVIRARREKQEVVEAVGPPLRHQIFSTSAAIRRRSASSGMRPYDAPTFSRTWSTRVVAGIAQQTAGCDTMNLSRSCG